MAEWWQPKLEDRLSQGDILPLLPVGGPAHPPKYLQRAATIKGGVNTWAEAPKWVAVGDGFGHYLARGRQLFAIVLNHSCELDKPGEKRVLVAPISPLSTLDADHRDAVLNQRRFALMPLPEIPTLGTYYADLRSIHAIDRKLASSGKRVASMTDFGRQRLQVQLIGFFTRTEF